VTALLLIILLYFLTILLLDLFKNNLSWFDTGLLKKLYWYHILFAIIYYIYVQSSASDSVGYYNRAYTSYENWMQAYGTGTTFIDFFAYPFVQYLGFSYEMMMVLFSWMGYWGFVFFYVLFSENVEGNHKILGTDLISFILFLPNMHYWSSSLGKGSIILFGLGMAMFGLSRLTTRKFILIISLLLIYHIRPHIFFLMALGILGGIVSSKDKVPVYLKFLLFVGIGAAVLFLFNDVMSFAKLDSENLMGSFDQLSAHRAEELAKSGSGIDISNYPLALKLFTFWFRPLFIDAPSFIGIFVSFENLFYLYLGIKIIKKDFIRFIIKSSALVKISAIVFFAVSFALSGTLSNLGIIIRQKSMVMFFFVFVVVMFLDYQQNGLQNRDEDNSELETEEEFVLEEQH
jgi:hypothetical protein